MHTNILIGKLEGKEFGRLRRGWEYIRVDLWEILWEGVEWIHLDQATD
jgi:hypothetical protein